MSTTRQIIRRRAIIAIAAHCLGGGLILWSIAPFLYHLWRNVPDLGYNYWFLMGGMLLVLLAWWIYRGTAHCVHCERIINSVFLGGIFKSLKSKEAAYCPRCGQSIGQEEAAREHTGKA